MTMRMRDVRCLALATLVLAGTGGQSVAQAAAVGLQDQVSAASDQARAALNGQVSIATVGDLVGDHDTRRPAWVVARGGSLTWKLRAVPDQPTTLEIEEIYGRDADVRGYSIFVNGAKAYFRTFRGCGAGPVHYFVQVPAQAGSEIEVRVTNEHDAPVAISRAWVFSGFAEHFRDSGMSVPYAFAPTVALSLDHAKDLAKLQTIKAAMASSPHARPAWTTWLGYANLTEAATREQIDHILRLAKDAGMPVQISFDTWWGNSPGGSDGKGGSWLDVRYQQVVFNETTKQLQLSIPNRWSNTPWRTMNDPDLNGYKTTRLRRATSYLRERVNAMTAAGDASPILSVNLDNEPVYWASGNAGLGNDELWADFNPLAIADAARAGVTLNPADGLSGEERRWLHRNILNYNKLIGEAAVAGLSHDAVVVKGDAIEPAAEPLANNIYTQAYVADPTLQFPLLDPAHGLWETAAPVGVRVGGEYNGDSQVEIEAITHQIALGRSAAVNAEAGNKDEAVGSVAPGFALGLRYWSPYNWPLDKMATAVRELEDQSRPLPPRLYERRLIEDDFRGDAWRSHAHEHGGVQTQILGNTAAMALAPTSADAPGYISYRLDAPAGGTFEGLALEFSGRAFVSQAKDERVHIRVLAGEAPDAASMREVKRIFNSGDINEVRRVDLTELASGKRALFVRVELHAPGLSGEHLSWCSLRRVGFTVPWPAEATQGLPKQDESIATLRTQNLVVAWRRDAELAMDQLAKRIGELKPTDAMWQGRPDASPPAKLRAARAAYEAGQYAAAYRAACAGASVALPARFHVQSGTLHPYPVQIDAKAPVLCEVHHCSDDLVRLRLHAVGAEAVAASVSVTKQLAGSRYHLHQTDVGELKLTRDSAGTLVVADDGTLKLDITASPTPVLAQPAEVAGSFKSTDKTLRQIQIIPDNGDGIRAVRFDDSMSIMLRDVSQPDAAAQHGELRHLQRGDQVTVSLGGNGIAAEVLIERGALEGTVEAFGQLTPTSMPTIRIAGDDKDHVIDLLATLHLPEGDTSARAQALGTLKIAAGDHVRVRLNPATGRVTELWKKH